MNSDVQVWLLETFSKILVFFPTWFDFSLIGAIVDSSYLSVNKHARLKTQKKIQNTIVYNGCLNGNVIQWELMSFFFLDIVKN